MSIRASGFLVHPKVFWGELTHDRTYKAGCCDSWSSFQHLPAPLQLEPSIIGECYNSSFSLNMTYRDPACPQQQVSAGPVEPRPDKQFGGILSQRQS